MKQFKIKTKNWDSLLPFMNYTMNSLPYSNIKSIPFFLNQYYPPTLLVKLLKGDEGVKMEVIASFISRIQRWRVIAKENLLKTT